MSSVAPVLVRKHSSSGRVGFVSGETYRNDVTHIVEVAVFEVTLLLKQLQFGADYNHKLHMYLYWGSVFGAYFLSDVQCGSSLGTETQQLWKGWLVSGEREIGNDHDSLRDHLYRAVP